jgi:hypothetical protein
MNPNTASILSDKVEGSGKTGSPTQSSSSGVDLLWYFSLRGKRGRVDIVVAERFDDMRCDDVWCDDMRCDDMRCGDVWCDDVWCDDMRCDVICVRE